MSGVLGVLLGDNGSSYVGPGDLVSGAIMWHGLRAYSAASIGSNAIKLRRSSDSTTQTFTTIAGGGLDIAGITTFKGASSLFVDTLYDQTGNGLHFTQATTALQPGFTLSGIGSLPIIDNTSTLGLLTTAAGPTNTQPLVASFVLNYRNSITDFAYFNNATSAVPQFRFNATSPGNVTTYAGVGFSPDVAATINTWHAIQLTLNGASSEIYLDGSGTTGSPGTSGFEGTSGSCGFLGRAGDNLQQFNGYAGELGFWPATFSAGQKTAMNSNQHTYWGF